MRALLAGQRNASVGVVLGLAGVVLLLIVSVGLNVKHMGDLDQLHDLIYKRCLSVSVPQNDARRVEVAEWNSLAEQERHNRFIDAPLRAQRAGSYQRLADAMQAAVDASEQNPCAAYQRADGQ